MFRVCAIKQFAFELCLSVVKSLSEMDSSCKTEKDSGDKSKSEHCIVGESICPRGVVSVLTLKHVDVKGNRSMLELVSQDDLVDFAASQEVEERMCRKDKMSGVQRKLSCWPCTIVMESVQVIFP